MFVNRILVAHDSVTLNILSVQVSTFCL